MYYFGDGFHRLYFERCCAEVVDAPAGLCKKHAGRHIGEYKTKDPRLLCQWNYVYHHGRINEPYNENSKMYGSPYYEAGLKKGWGVPKKADLEKAQDMQKAVLDLVDMMQTKITDYMKKDLAEFIAPSPPPAALKKKRVQSDQSSTGSSTVSTSSVRSMYVPKGPVEYAEAEDEPIIIDDACITVLVLKENPKGGWVDEAGNHYKKTGGGLIEKA
jgi:hypothetical protein